MCLSVCVCQVAVAKLSLHNLRVCVLNVKDWLHPPTQHSVRGDSEESAAEKDRAIKNRMCSCVFSPFFSLFPQRRETLAGRFYLVCDGEEQEE